MPRNKPSMPNPTTHTKPTDSKPTQTGHRTDLPVLRHWQRVSQSAEWQNLRDRVFNSQVLVQAGKTPFAVIYDDGLAKLRHYAPHPDAPTQHRVPLVIVAPLAVNMLVYDLFPERSLIQYLTQQGFTVYLIDWGKPTRRHAKRNFHSYILSYLPAMLREARQHSGQQQLSLHGWSMAGIFTLLYAAYSQDPDLKNIIIMGSPIDSYASGNIGQFYRRAGQVFRWTEQRWGWHPRTLPAQLLHSQGWSNALGFKLLDPVGTLKGHTNMLKQLDNRDAVAAHATLGAFLDHMVDYPGGVNRDMLLKIWLDNPLSQGEFKIGGKTVYLKDIHAAMLVGAGRNDGMVSVDAVRPLVNLVGSTDATFTTVPGGHVGMIGSEAASQEFWPLMSAWLAQRSD